MAAPTNAAHVKKTFANPEPSTALVATMSPGVALRLGPHRALQQGQEPGRARSEARGGGGLGARADDGAAPFPATVARRRDPRELQGERRDRAGARLVYFEDEAGRRMTMK